MAMPLQNEREVVRSAGRQAIASFLESHNCFSVLRASGKVVVFDVNIPIQLAFYALVEHGKVLLQRVFVLVGTAGEEAAAAAETATLIHHSLCCRYAGCSVVGRGAVPVCGVAVRV